jgi:DNA-binding NarL/FixJ family response regulator
VSSDRISVLIADDQAVVRAGFRIILSGQPDLTVVGEAVDGEEAVAAAARLRPDVVLMDIRMPRMDGIQATRQIVAAHPDGRVRVLVITTFELDEYVFNAIHAGASGFLLKDISPEQLAEAVRIVHAGEGLLAPAVTRRLIEEFARTHVPAGRARQLPDTLTPRELDVLRMVAKGLSNAEIAAELYLGESTVKTHVGRVLTKLGLRDRVQAVVYAYETGLVRPGT